MYTLRAELDQELIILEHHILKGLMVTKHGRPDFLIGMTSNLRNGFNGIL